MNAADRAAYPKTAAYIHIELPKVVMVPAIVLAMKNIAQLQKAQLTAALFWGNGPLVKVAPLIGALGEFTPDSGSQEIRIATSLVNEFETGHGRRVARAGNVYLLGVTILHELVHWGDDQDGVDRPGEEGSEFENLVYGSVIF